MRFFYALLVPKPLEGVFEASFLLFTYSVICGNFEARSRRIWIGKNYSSVHMRVFYRPMQKIFKKREGVLFPTFWVPKKSPLGPNINSPGARGDPWGPSFGPRGAKNEVRKKRFSGRVKVLGSILFAIQKALVGGAKNH